MRRTITVVLLASALTACSRLGLGEADCTPPDRSISAATILVVQAVPSARYTPCLDEPRLGWDEVQWFFEDGRAGMNIYDSVDRFLRVTVTGSCDVSGAELAPSRYPDIVRYEDVESQPPEVGITIVPAGEAPLATARRHVDELAGTEIEHRSVIFTIDARIDEPIRARVDQALLQGRYAWIVDELDAEEGTVEQRGENPAVAARGITPQQALEVIGGNLPEVFYRGSWYFEFEGGCITYEFDAVGAVAESVADDADDAIGFYPAAVLREGARQDGYDVGG
jgi:hypothetical protein